MRTLIAIALAALVGVAVVSPALSGPGADAARSRIRTLEQRVLDADASMPAARLAANRASRRLATAREQLATVEGMLTRSAASHRAGQEILAKRLRALYREGVEDPLLVVLITSGNLSAVADREAALNRAAQRDASMVAHLRADRRQMSRLTLQRRRERDVAAAAMSDAAERRAELTHLRTRRAAALGEARRTLRRIQAREARTAAGRARQAAAATVAPAGPTTTPPNGRWPAVPGGPSRATLDRVAQCESGGNPRSVSSSGSFRGKYQFITSTWQAVGGAGDPAGASEAEQDYRAALLWVRSGPGQWPVCAAFAR